jgi:hypothetical protein
MLINKKKIVFAHPPPRLLLPLLFPAQRGERLKTALVTGRSSLTYQGIVPEANKQFYSAHSTSIQIARKDTTNAARLRTARLSSID